MKRSAETFYIEPSQDDDQESLLSCFKEDFATEEVFEDIESNENAGGQYPTSSLEKTAVKDKIFAIERGCDARRKKHMLKFDQISALENFFINDPKWSSETIGKQQ